MLSSAQHFAYHSALQSITLAISLKKEVIKVKNTAMGKGKRLSVDNEVALIEAVKDRKPLYDKRVDGYHTSNKELAWEEVAQVLGISEVDGDAARKVWVSLRQQYMAHKRKLRKPSGSGNSNRPYFRHAELMRFINDSLGDNDETYSNLDSTAPNAENETEATDMEEESPKVHPPLAATCRPDHRSHKKSVQKRKLDPFDEGLLDLLKTDDKDEYASFGEVVAAKLRKLAQTDAKVSLEAQHEINAVIHKSEMSIL